jgi:deoxyribodipyrimidine photolyase
MHTLIWFHRDLRCFDHPGLHWAHTQGHKISAALIPPHDAGAHKLAHWNLVASELAGILSKRGVEVHFLTSSADITSLVKSKAIDLVLTHERMSTQEQSTLVTISHELGARLRIIGELTLYPSAHAQQLTLNDLKPFTKFKKYAEAHWEVPTLSPAFDETPTQAVARLKDYIWETRAVTHYHETRNGMLRFNDSSKLSPWLAWGALSARRVYGELKAFTQIHGPSEGVDGLVYELIWRDYFKFLAKVQGPFFFERQGLRATPPETRCDEGLFEAWRRGETAVDFVDANMRELLHTGWMSNRGRQNVASFLAKTLKLDWTLGAQWFAQKLIDEDPENNYGNWQYVAGVGTDPRDRIFDVNRQASLYDPQGEYQTRWLGEDREIAQEIMKILLSRAPDKTMCPSEVLIPEHKKDPQRMEAVRASARRLWRQGHLEITQKGNAVNPYLARGPIRLKRR